MPNSVPPTGVPAGEHRMKEQAITPPFVDTHVHFWDHSVEGLSWSWLEPDFEHPRVQSLHRYDAPRFTTPELRREAEGSGLATVVHVQAARWNHEPERETAWLQRVGDEHGWPDAVVGNCRLAAPDAAAVMERHAAFSRFRGVRDLTAAPQLDDPLLVEHVGAVGEHGGVVELLVSKEEFAATARVADAQPGVTIVIDHAGLPVERTPEYHREWLRGMRELGRAANVVCKISALAGSVDPQWSVESLRPWVEGCVEAFGVERCMFATNWPIDKPYGTYVGLVDAYRQIVASWPAGEQEALLAGTAERVYRL